jgi:hypothetical protein
VLGAEVFVVSTSVCATGYFTGFLGLLASVVSGRGSSDACGWTVWDICVVWVDV